MHLHTRIDKPNHLLLPPPLICFDLFFDLSSMPRLTIRLFGYPQFQVDDNPVQVERRKTLAARNPANLVQFNYANLTPPRHYPR